MSKFLLTGIVWAIICILFSPRTVRGDIAPLPSLTAVVQEGQDVKITVTRKASTIEAVGSDSFDLVRHQAVEETPVVSGYRLSFDGISASAPTCGDMYYSPISIEEFCETYPEDCHQCDDASDTVCIGEDCTDCSPVGNPYCCYDLRVDETFCAEYFCASDTELYRDFCNKYPAYNVDCDGDGTANCCLACDENMYFDLWDICVPPGMTDYTIFNDWGESSSMSLEVTNTGDDCLGEIPTEEPPPTDEPVTTEVSTTTETPTETDVSTETGNGVATDESSETDSLTSTDMPPETDSTATTQEQAESDNSVPTVEPAETASPITTEDTSEVGDTDTGHVIDDGTGAKPRRSDGCSAIPGQTLWTGRSALSLIDALFLSDF